MLRQSGQLASGGHINIYTADMRRQVLLQFYPDGYEWAEDNPVLISEGYSSHSAGVDGTQELPSKFRVARGGTQQHIYINREITNDWMAPTKVHLQNLRRWDEGLIVLRALT